MGGGPGGELAGLRRLHRLVARLNSRTGLAETLQAVVDGVVGEVGFGVAAINYAHPDGAFEVLAAAGPPDARAALLGQRLPADAFDADLARAEEWGALRFVPQERFTPDMVSHWVPSGTGATDVPGGWRPLDALFAPLHAPSGRLVGMLSVDAPSDGRRPGPVARELLEMYAAQAGIAVDNARLTHQLQLSEEAFRLAFHGAGVGMALVSLDPAQSYRYLRVNPALCQLTGYTAEELLARTALDITHPDDRADALAGAQSADAGGHAVHRTDKRYRRADGATVWVTVTTTALGGTAHQGPFALSQVEDITARRHAEAVLTHRATHDPLTGLPNRFEIGQRLTAVLARTRRSRRPGALLYCDLDGFKTVNDTRGHPAGDTVLAEVAHRLAAEVRTGDTVARIGGDEFLILAEDITYAQVTHLRDRLTRAVAQPVTALDPPITVTVSIGVAAITEHSTDTDGVIRAADHAMYQTKRRRHPVR